MQRDAAEEGWEMGKKDGVKGLVSLLVSEEQDASSRAAEAERLRAAVTALREAARPAALRLASRIVAAYGGNTAAPRKVRVNGYIGAVTAEELATLLVSDEADTIIDHLCDMMQDSAVGRRVSHGGIVDKSRSTIATITELVRAVTEDLSQGGGAR